MRDTSPDTWSTSALIEAAYVEQYEDDFQGSCPATVALHSRGTREVLDAALTLCQSLDPKWRSLAATILGELGWPDRTFPEECCDALLRLLHDRDEDVVIAAIHALGVLGNHRCDPELLRFETHPEPEIRKAVAGALLSTTLPEAVPVLLRLMDDPDIEVRDWATTTVAEAAGFDTPEIRDALLERATSGDDALTRGEALLGLARRGDRRAAPRLIAELSGDAPYPFEEAAKICLGFDEGLEITVETLLENFRATRH
jgi:HEAT repeat protein